MMQVFPENYLSPPPHAESADLTRMIRPCFLRSFVPLFLRIICMSACLCADTAHHGDARHSQGRARSPARDRGIEFSAREPGETPIRFATLRSARIVSLSINRQGIMRSSVVQPRFPPLSPTALAEPCNVSVTLVLFFFFFFFPSFFFFSLFFFLFFSSFITLLFSSCRPQLRSEITSNRACNERPRHTFAPLAPPALLHPPPHPPHSSVSISIVPVQTKFFFYARKLALWLNTGRLA